MQLIKNQLEELDRLVYKPGEGGEDEEEDDDEEEDEDEEEEEDAAPRNEMCLKV